MPKRRVFVFLFPNYRLAVSKIQTICAALAAQIWNVDFVQPRLDNCPFG